MLKEQKNLLLILGIFAVACIGLSLSRYLYSGTIRHLYLPWNLFLAFVPLFFALFAIYAKRLSTFWVLFALWLVFLPNAFYIVTDLIHLNPIESNLEGYQVGNYRYANEPNSPGILFDSVLLFMFAAYGFLLGLMATGKVHDKLRTFFDRQTSWLIILSSLFLSSFAIYLGRHLRWNSWDALFNLPELGRDIADIFISPVVNAEAWAVTILFFFLTSTFYGLYRSLRQL